MKNKIKINTVFPDVPGLLKSNTIINLLIESKSMSAFTRHVHKKALWVGKLGDLEQANCLRNQI